MEEAEGEDGEDQTREKLAEVRDIQRECWRTPRGVPPAPELLKQDKDVEEEEEEHWGLDAGFSGGSTKQGPDPHLEAFLNERLYEKKGTSEEAKEKTREEKLYEIPDGLQVADNQGCHADKMSWVAGLAEVPLGIEHKLANIEATEKAKRAYLYGESSGTGKPAVLEPDAVTRKAFGSRFLGVASTDSKGSTDDAVVERFRKRMRL